MSWVFPSAQRTISYNEFKPATDMVLSTFFAHASELVPLPKITSHLRLVGPIRATPASRSIAVARVPIILGSPLRCSTWLQSKAGLSMSCMCITIKREFGICFTKVCKLHTHQNGVHQHGITSWREFQRVPQSASTCLFANSPRARFVPPCMMGTVSCIM